MLGLSSGLIYSSYLTGISNPTDVSNLIGWWDFTDNTNGNLSNSHSSASAPSNGDGINRIKNKAYHNQGNTTTAIGESLYSPNVFTGATNALAPEFVSGSSDTTNRPPAESASNPISYALFNTRTGPDLGNGTDYLPYMRCRYNIYQGESNTDILGTVQSTSDLHTNLSTSAISMAAHTVFTVERRVTNLDTSGGTGLYQGAVWSMQGYDPQYSSGGFADLVFGRGFWAENTFTHFNDHIDFGSGGLGNSTMYDLFADSANPTTSERRQWRPHGLDTDSDFDSGDFTNLITNDNKFAIWTTIVNGESATTTSEPFLRGGRMYRNYNTAKGIDADSFISVSNTLDDTQDSGARHEYNTGTKFNKLNLGMSDATPTVTLSTPLEFSLGKIPSMGTTGLYNSSLGKMPGPTNEVHQPGDSGVGSRGFSRGTAIYEILFYNKVLSSGEIAGVENYLKNKYGDPENLY